VARVLQGEIRVFLSLNSAGILYFWWQ